MTIRNIIALAGRHGRLTFASFVIAAALAVAGHPVQAESPTVSTTFKDLDMDGDMRLDASETASHPHLKDKFKMVDGDGDGYISEREFAIGVPAEGKGRPTESWFTKPAHKPK